MKEFEELLNEVLREDVRVEVPAGMERRIALALASERKRALSKRRIWLEALAATILLGLAGTWAHKGLRPMLSVAHKAGSVAKPRPIPEDGARRPLPSRNSQGPVLERVSIPETRPRRQLQRKTLRLAPLEIEPLAIEPIEIASLTSSTSTGKGEVR